MADISIGAAVSEGFSLIRRKPLTVLAWGAVPTFITIGLYTLMGPYYLSTIGMLVRTAANHGVPDTTTLVSMRRGQSLSYLISLAGMFVNSAIYCAVFRSVLHPDQSRLAYLRLGAPELINALLFIGAYIGMFVAMVVAMIPIGIVASVLFLTHLQVLGAAAIVVGGIAAAAGFLYLVLRLCLVAPMLVDTGRLELDLAWRLSRGRTAALFAIALVAFLTVFVGQLLVILLVVATGARTIGQAGDLQNAAVFFQQAPSAILLRLWPVLALAAVLWVPFQGATAALMGGPLARAYRDLRPQRDIAETFA